DPDPDDALEAARVPVAPRGVALVGLPPDAARGVEAARNGDVEQRRPEVVVDQHAYALGRRVDRGRRRHRDGALEPHLLAARNVEPRDPHLRLDGEHRADVRAGVAGVTDAVVITIRLRGVRGRRTIVERVAYAVAVAVRLPGVGRAGGIRAGAHLREVTAGGHAAADGTCGDECVGWTVIPDTVAVLGDVASADCRPAGSRALRVSRTGRARRVAALGQVAGTGGGPADGAGRHERGRRAVVGSPGAGSRRGPTRGAGGDEGIGRAVVADAVAALVDVAHVGRGAADRRALGIRGTGRARPVTVLLEVAGARRGMARGAGGDEGVGGTVV